MNVRLIPHLLAASFLMVGCGARHVQVDSDTLLVGAHASLERGDLAEASRRLDRAEAGVCTDHNRKTIEILRAETEIRNRDPGQARSRMITLLDEYPKDPRAHEVAGKASLRLADFGAASRHFQVAERNYSDAIDRGRAADLLTLSNGLQAYSNGRLDAAHETWTRIKDHQLRARVMDAYNVVAPQAAVQHTSISNYSLSVAK